LALSGFIWKNNKKIASYHFVMAIMTLFMPQWLLGVSTGEAAAIYCFYSIPITASFMPYFKRFFTAENFEENQRDYSLS
jgi:nitric oxide reductase large subunit